MIYLAYLNIYSFFINILWKYTQPFGISHYLSLLFRLRKIIMILKFCNLFDDKIITYINMEIVLQKIR